jgi:hypothetical protein
MLRDSGLFLPQVYTSVLYVGWYLSQENRREVNLNMSILKHCDCGGVCEATGNIMHGGDCPLARMIAQKLGADGAVVGRTETFLVRDKVVERYLTSSDLIGLICHFEQTGEVLVGTYGLLPVLVN